MTTNSTGSVDTAGAKIAWTSYGDESAPVIVFSHSLGLDSSMWEPQIENLSDQFRLVAVDLRGHGNSGRSDDPLTLEVLAGDVLTAATDAGIDRFHFCGISVGGQIVQWMAINRPQRLASIVIANTAARIGSKESWSDRAAAIRSGGMESILRSSRGRFFSPDFETRNPDRLRATLATLEACDPAAYIAVCEMLARNDLRHDVGSIDLPTLVITGQLDQSTTPEQAKWLHERIAGSELVELEGAAHISNLDRPEAFTAAVRGFLTRNRIS
ncbi:MAG: 3-oxoadipate enol-lactonase [Acidimicrobiia bacterium]